MAQRIGTVHVYSRKDDETADAIIREGESWQQAAARAGKRITHGTYDSVGQIDKARSYDNGDGKFARFAVQFGKWIAKANATSLSHLYFVDVRYV